MVFNARSLCNKTFGVCEFLKDKDCDLCFVTEAWVKLQHGSVLAEIRDAGFDIKLQPRKGSRRGGGVCVLYKLGINVDKCTTKSYKTFEVLQIVRTRKSCSATCVLTTKDWGKLLNTNVFFCNPAFQPGKFDHLQHLFYFET